MHLTFRRLMLEQFYMNFLKRCSSSSPHWCTVPSIPGQLYKVLLSANKLWSKKKMQWENFKPPDINGKYSQKLQTQCGIVLPNSHHRLLLQMCWPSRLSSVCPEAYSKHSYQAVFSPLKKHPPKHVLIPDFSSKEPERLIPNCYVLLQYPLDSKL